MSGAERSLARTPARPPGRASPGRRAGPTAPGAPASRVLELQRQAGNAAVSRLLSTHATLHLQRAPSPESPPVTTLTPPGTMDEQQWTRAYRAAVAAPTVAAYDALFRDLAATAGMDRIPGFALPATLPTSDGTTARPGLNITLRSGETGHTAWVARDGRFGVRLRPTKRQPPEVGIAVILGPVALSADKGQSLRTVRHEMVHALHKVKVLDAVRAWQAAPGGAGLETWLGQQLAKRRMSALDVALVGKGAQDAASDTEVLAYVEGFTADFHRRPATLPGAAMSFFELLGVVVTEKVYPWAGADPAVRKEALDRLADYRGRLDPDRQRLWKEWLDRERAKTVRGQPGRDDFLRALSAFVV